MRRMDETRRAIEAREEESVAPWGLRSSRASRARPLDPEGRLFDYRTEYQRDRDRILHSRAFRRLRQKTDGGPLSPIDPRRDTLTLTLEVTQLARTIARALALNEDLTEAVALGRALGTPPFGAPGARVLDSLLRRGRPPLRSGFSIPMQSLRVVDLLEKRYDHEGLNLTHDVREGLFKQAPVAGTGRRPSGRVAEERGGIGSQIESGSLRIGLPPSLEAQVVAISGGIASTLGAMDDALRSGEIEPGDLERVPIVRELIRRVGARYPQRARGRLTVKANVLHRGLAHLMVTATIQSTRKTLRTWVRQMKIESHQEFLAAREALPAGAVGPGQRITRLLEGLRAALQARVGTGAGAAQAGARARRVIGSLLGQYMEDPRLLDDYVLFRFRELAGGRFLRDLPSLTMETEIDRRYHGSGVLLRLVADHIAGMTDAYARFEHGRLSGLTPDTAAGTDRS